MVAEWNTHDDDDEAGFAVMFTVITATKPSMALLLEVATLWKWLIPSLVFCSRPDTYCTDVRYVYPPKDAEPEYVDWFVKFAVGMISDWPVAFPTSQPMRIGCNRGILAELGGRGGK